MIRQSKRARFFKNLRSFYSSLWELRFRRSVVSLRRSRVSNVIPTCFKYVFVALQRVRPHVPDPFLATFRCITLRGRAGLHFCYSFAGNVPLHHIPRTGFVPLSLSVCGQRSVASYSADGPGCVSVIPLRAMFRCITLRGSVPLHHTPRTGSVTFSLFLRGQRFLKVLRGMFIYVPPSPKYGAGGADHRRGRAGDLRSGGRARFACRPNGAEINYVRKLIASRAAVTAAFRLLLPASAVYPSSFSRIYSAEFAQARLSARRPCRGDKPQAAKRDRRQYTLPPAAGSSRSYIIWS